MNLKPEKPYSRSPLKPADATGRNANMIKADQAGFSVRPLQNSADIMTPGLNGTLFMRFSADITAAEPGSSGEKRTTVPEQINIFLRRLSAGRTRLLNVLRNCIVGMPPP